MNIRYPLIKSLCIIFCIITLVNFIFPELLQFTKKYLPSNSKEDITTSLLIIDILLGIFWKIQIKKCEFNISVTNKLDEVDYNPKICTDSENFYAYSNKRNAYEHIVYLDRPALSGTEICFEIKLLSDSIVNTVEYSNLDIFIFDEAKCIKKFQRQKRYIEIKSQIAKYESYLLRLVLAHSRNLEHKMSDSRIHISFIMKAIDENRVKHRKYVFLLIQNINGKANLLTTTFKKNWIGYKMYSIWLKKKNNLDV